MSQNEAPMTSGMPSRHRGSPAPILDCVLSAVQLRLATDHIWPQVGRDGSIFFAESWDRQLLIGSVCVEKNIFICVFYVIISVYINQIMGTLYTIYIYIRIYILCSYRLEYYVIWFLNISHVHHIDIEISCPCVPFTDKPTFKPTFLCSLGLFKNKKVRTPTIFFPNAQGFFATPCLQVFQLLLSFPIDRQLLWV